MRHRQYLEDDWQVSFELSYITDRNFLEEFFESEFDNGKEQETLLYFKRQRDNWAATGLFQWRILDWLTQTESLPDLGLWWMGPSPLGRGALYSENRFGVVRYRPREQTLREFLDDGHVESSGTTARGDTRQEVDYPLDLGPFRVVPFASGRLTAWDQTVSTGSAWRIFGSYGLRGSLYLTKVYPDLESTFWDIQGIRHISKLDFTVWASHTNVDSHVLHPFTEGVETIDEIDGVVVGLRNRFQTKRGPEDDRRTVDVVTTEWEVGLFNDATGERTTNGYASYTRPEDSIARNYMAHSIIWRINDRTALVTESNTDLNDLDTAIFNLSYVVERSPRLSYLIGYRFILETDSHLLAFDLNYRMTEKHSIALRPDPSLSALVLGPVVRAGPGRRRLRRVAEHLARGPAQRGARLAPLHRHLRRRRAQCALAAIRPGRSLTRRPAGRARDDRRTPARPPAAGSARICPHAGGGGCRSRRSRFAAWAAARPGARRCAPPTAASEAGPIGPLPNRAARPSRCGRRPPGRSRDTSSAAR
jgi:hypothetical protein